MKTWKQFLEGRVGDQTHRFNPQTGKWEPVDPHWATRDAEVAAANAKFQPETPHQQKPMTRSTYEDIARDLLIAWIKVAGRDAVRDILQRDNAQIIEFGKFSDNRQAKMIRMPTRLSQDRDADKIIDAMRSLSHLV